MADKLDMGEITSFDKAKLKKMETPEKNTLQTKEITEKEKRSESSSFIRIALLFSIATAPESIFKLDS
ncbi:thymosin beta-10-like [Ursus maritimus]|uniref:Thymosin beta-10 n=1 Tax=Ursus maritimus TaxID=29073 RepID=A0A384BQM4_URSMA|nr:thymosin beta-10-like [Ursus maritimus]